MSKYFQNVLYFPLLFLLICYSSIVTLFENVLILSVRDKRTLIWENGRREGISRGRHPWSFGGSRGPQPDGQGSEDCLAILNNVYNDGVKFHDVGCSHRKPTVCEQ